MASLQQTSSAGPLFDAAASASEYRGMVGPEPDETLRPAARASDPSTSHAAADAITASGKRAKQMRLVADAVRAYPGHTSYELSALSGLDRYTVARRAPEAEAAGLIRRGDKRTCEKSGQTALTWWPLEK